jgi:hypothetical protein
MSLIPVHLAVEDDLSESVLRRLLHHTRRDYAVGSVFARGGFGYLRSRTKNFNSAAISGTPIILLTDLDQYPCASHVIQEWLGTRPHEDFIFRVAVREVESWLLADRKGLADFLNVSKALVPTNSDELRDSKQALISIARRSGVRELRESLVPRPRSTATQGPDYNRCLIDYVQNIWNCDQAVEGSPSLQRAWNRLINFEPTWS